MSTTTVDLQAEAGALSSEKQTYRKYVNGDKERVLSESDTKDKKTGLSVNWQKAEDEGYSLATQNDAIVYSVKSSDGFELLVPDEEIRMYIINAGLSTIQTARMNAFMKATTETDGAPLYNDATLDLRIGVGEDGEYSINKAPTRRSLSDIEKLVKQLTALGIPPEQQKAVLMSYAQAKQDAAAVTEEVAA